MTLFQDMLITLPGWERLSAELGELRQRRQTMLREINEDGRTSQLDVLNGSLRADLGLLDRRIAQVEEALARAVPIGEADGEPGVVGVGSRVEVEWEDGETESYLLVGPPEVDVAAGHISYEAPVGKALLASRAGDHVDVRTPLGMRSLMVLQVH